MSDLGRYELGRIYNPPAENPDDYLTLFSVFAQVEVAAKIFAASLEKLSVDIHELEGSPSLLF